MNSSAQNPHIVIGLGSGRCGTQSLARLLDAQPGAHVTHERVYQNIKWNGSEDRVLEMLEWARGLDNPGLRGDVASYYLSYVDFILSRQPEARFICLRRPRNETVDSFMRITPGKNHWFDHGGEGWEPDMWDDSFPSYPDKDKRAALTRYWNEYYAEAERLKAVYPERFRIFDTTALNDRKGQAELLRFAGVAPEQQRLKPGIRRNTHADRKRHDRKLAARERRQELLEKIRGIFS